MSEPGAANWLSLAAAPTFAVLALLNGAGSQPSPICTTAADAWPIGDMALMYLLMSVFHAAPWLRLITARCRAGNTTATSSGACRS